MKKKEVIDLIISLALFVLASCILVVPVLKVSDLKTILIIIFCFYILFKFTQFILIFKEHDYESLFTALVSIIALIMINVLTFNTKNVVLILLGWMALMCVIKLKKADFYNDRHNKMWIIRLFILFVFLISGLLMGINLMYEAKVQIIVIGYFFLINSILDAIDPITDYLMRSKNESHK